MNFFNRLSVKDKIKSLDARIRLLETRMDMTRGDIGHIYAKMAKIEATPQQAASDLLQSERINLEIFPPDIKWDDLDRRRIISALACVALGRLQNGKTSLLATLDVLDRIRLIAERTASFLEANRDSILGGQ